MTIPNVVLGELIDPVTFGNAVVDAVNEHETEISDRLPLSGGTLTGDLQVNGKLVLDGTWDGAKLSNHPSPVREILSIGDTTGGGSQINLYGPDDESTPGHVDIYTAGVVAARFDNEKHARLYGNLQVDGYFRTLGNARIDGVIHSPGTYANSGGGVANVHVTSSGYFYRTGTRGGAFAPSKLARNFDVLDRAETATLPPEIETDEDGNQTNTAEVEAHDTVELFDVVTGLLAKVKQLEERIEALEA